MIDYFVDGQPCDELKGKEVNARHTEVHFRCCEIMASGQLKSPGETRDMYIAEIAEPSVCSYNMTLCLSALCQPRREETLGLSGATLSGVLRALMSRTQCLSLVEGWWTYELCFAKNVRQFHPTSKLSSIESGEDTRIVEVCGLQYAHRLPSHYYMPLNMYFRWWSRSLFSI